jgi:SH3-like domain-containing protein
VLLTGRPVVIVGNDFLSVGDSVPRFASVKVQSITESEVIYVYQNKEFPVEVIGSF